MWLMVGGGVRQCLYVLCCCIFKAFFKDSFCISNAYLVVFGLFLPKIKKK